MTWAGGTDEVDNGDKEKLEISFPATLPTATEKFPAFVYPGKYILRRKVITLPTFSHSVHNAGRIEVTGYHVCTNLQCRLTMRINIFINIALFIDIVSCMTDSMSVFSPRTCVTTGCGGGVLDTRRSAGIPTRLSSRACCRWHRLC